MVGAQDPGNCVRCVYLPLPVIPQLSLVEFDPMGVESALKKKIESCDEVNGGNKIESGGGVAPPKSSSV